MQRYYAAALTAFLIWGFMPIVVRSLQGYHVNLILYFRILLSLFLLVGAGFLLLSDKWKLAVAHFKKQTKAEKNKVISLTIFSGFLLVLNWGIFIYVVNYIDTQSGAFAYTLCPIITAILGYLILGEKLEKHQWFAIGLCIVSCAFMATGVLRNFLFSLLVGTLYALYLVLQRFLKDYDKIVLLTIQLLIAALCVLPFYQFTHAPEAIFSDVYFFGLIAVVSLVFTVIPLFLNLYALKALKSATVGVFMYLNPLTGFIIAFFYFKEDVTTLQMAAYALICLAIILYNFPASWFGRLQPVRVKK